MFSERSKADTDGGVGVGITADGHIGVQGPAMGSTGQGAGVGCAAAP